MTEAHFAPLPTIFHHLVGHSLFPFDGVWPSLAPDVFIAPGSRIIGTVSLAAGSSVWFNAVIRGDINAIAIGERTNIQDTAVLHVGSGPDGGLTLGDEVVVGHAAILHACTIANRVLVGMGATVLDGAVVESGCIIAAGAVVTPRSCIPAGSLVAGIPAKVLRQVTPAEIEDIAGQAGRYVELARRTRESLA